MKQVAPKLPDNIVDELRQLLDMGESYQFAIGDYLVSVVDEFSHVIKRPDIIRQLATDCKCDASTLRDRESLARFVTKQMRADYEVFTFSQWRALRCAGDRWKTYADKALDDNLWSSEKIRYEIAHDKNGQPYWQYWWKKLDEIANKLGFGEGVPLEVSSFAQKALIYMEDIQEKHPELWYNNYG